MIADLSGIIHKRTREKHEVFKTQPAFVQNREAPITKPVTTFSDSWRGSLYLRTTHTTRTHCWHKMPVPSARANLVSPVYPRLRYLYMCVATASTISTSQCYHLSKLNYSSVPIMSMEFTGSKFNSFFCAMDREAVGMRWGYKQHYTKNNTQLTLTYFRINVLCTWRF
jgi:hypothetical protein